MRRRFAIFMLASILAAMFFSPSAFGIEPWETRISEECCYMPIESGAVEPQYFTMVNAGTETWGGANKVSINLGTANPNEAQSPFQAQSWPTPTRAEIGEAHEVKPGEPYKFVFDVKGPPVSVPTKMTAYFGLLAENQVWMDEGVLGPLLWLEYEVLPASPPLVALAPAAPEVTMGEPLTVSVHGEAVASLNRIVVAFAGQQVIETVPRNPNITPDEQPAWGTTTAFSTTGLGIGPQTVVATAYDDAGLSSTTATTIVVKAPAVPPTPPQRRASVLAIPSLAVGARDHGHQLTRLAVSHVSHSAAIYAVCRHCSGLRRPARIRIRSRHGSLKLRSLFVNRRSELVIFAVGAPAFGRYKQYRFPTGHVGSISVTREGCLIPGAMRATECPS